MKDDKQNEVVINEKSMEILVAKFIPTSQYFERSFDMLQEQLRENKEEIRDFKQVVDKRFEQVDKKIDDFKSEVDKRFEQVNDSIIKLTFKIEELTKAQEVTIRDYIIERDRYYDSKFANLRMFNIAIVSLVAGVILKMAGIINF